MLTTREVGPLTLSVGSLKECVDVVSNVPHAPHVHFANAYTIALADAHAQYAALLNDGITFTDGVPVAWVGRRSYGVGSDQWPRVYGPDFMQAVLARGGRHYLLGGSGSTLQALRNEIARLWPMCEVAGYESPPFRSLTSAERNAQDARIEASGAHFVWVGLGTPKQDWEAARITATTGVTSLAVGAAFDFLAGTKPQAPQWMQRNGLEWTHRMATEPRRLSRRYLWGNPRFLMAAFRNPGFRRG